ncbi:DUF1778 domain-containing protein [Spiribacter sp. C176]|uniref:DUF1778 domain-containing protein n=1 Tax=Spiribacter salilacus TaxID=2664894 RepID=A0A6N7QRK1_9GAMM|nr:DUF1778 domain-containing protein [Spiribacter salilacus]MRH79091.1 DUF1778 domain-containing protein [Spiribacter salilacus]
MTQSVAMNMKAEPQVRSLIDRAAKLTHRNRTEFVLEAAVQRAEEVILEQSLILVSPERYQAFVDALDAPPTTNPRVQKVLEHKAPWE